MAFDTSSASSVDKLDNFSKYVRRQSLARFMVQNELFKMQLHIKGSIVEGGVHHGGGLMAWAQLSAILEPYNYRRKVIGFDTFEGFPELAEIDHQGSGGAQVGDFSVAYDVVSEIDLQASEFDAGRPLGHIPKVELVRGDACVEIPRYIEEHPSLLVSLLFLDFDIYLPTRVALEALVPRMPSGAIVAFDEVNNESWPGETVALLESLGLENRSLRCFPFEPNISYIVL